MSLYKSRILQCTSYCGGNISTCFGFDTQHRQLFRSSKCDQLLERKTMLAPVYKLQLDIKYRCSMLDWYIYIWSFVNVNDKEISVRCCLFYIGSDYMIAHTFVISMNHTSLQKQNGRQMSHGDWVKIQIVRCKVVLIVSRNTHNI